MSEYLDIYFGEPTLTNSLFSCQFRIIIYVDFQTSLSRKMLSIYQIRLNNLLYENYKISKQVFNQNLTNICFDPLMCE